ncbi:MAG: flippase-like domain-containing protein [Chitinivibrionales bacterium]|nr:flippase-like domain-containing protein [Chitinivibrionales bacterium]MBD3397248.1 flippase-like domain-containing protein [Chitinivibrionales bacterium]
MGGLVIMGQQRRKGGTVADRSEPKGIAGFLAKLGITALVIAFIVWRLGWRSIMSAFAQADYAWVFLGFALFVLSGILGSFQWRLLLHNKGIPMRFPRALMLYFVGMFFNNFVFGMIAGDAVKIALVRSSSGQGRAGFAATFLDRFAGLLAMAVLALFGSAILLKRGLVNDGRTFTAVLAVAGTFALFCGVLSFVISRRVQRMAFAVLEVLPLPSKPRIVGILQKIVFEVHDRHMLAPIAGLSMLIQLMHIGVHILCAASLGLLSPANFQYFFIFVPILAMLMMIPLPFGIKEGIGGTLFMLAGFSPESPEAPMVMEFLASLVGIAASLVGGVLFVTGRLRKAQPRT